jgi:hypothetical protein
MHKVLIEIKAFVAASRSCISVKRYKKIHAKENSEAYVLEPAFAGALV